METRQRQEGDFTEAWFETQAKVLRFWADPWFEFLKPTENDKSVKAWADSWKTSGDTYSRLPNMLYEFWARTAKILSDASPEGKGIQETYQEFCNCWLRDYSEILKKLFTISLIGPTSDLPDSSVKLGEMYTNIVSKFFRQWMGAMGNLPGEKMEALLEGPYGYGGVHRLWLEAYEQTSGKVLRIPPMGLMRETIEKVQQNNKALIDYCDVLTNYSSALSQVATKAQQTVVTKLFELHQKGEAPKTYKEFYTLWWTTNEDFFQELFKTPEFSSLLGQVVNSTMRVRKTYDAIMEEWLKAIPVPRRSEMDDLYKTLYLLKKEVRKNTKQAKALETKLGEVREITKRVTALEMQQSTAKTAPEKEGS